MNGIRLILCSLMLAATQMFAAREDMYNPETSCFKKGKFWYKETCQKEYAGTLHHPPENVKNVYQYTLSFFKPTTGAPGSGDLTICYVQLDHNTYRKLMNFVKESADQDMTLMQEIKELKKQQKQLCSLAITGITDKLNQQRIVLHALKQYAKQYNSDERDTVEMKDLQRLLQLEADALKKRRSKKE